MAMVARREDPALRHCRSQCGDNHEGAALQRRCSFIRRVAALGTPVERAGLLRPLFARCLLAKRSGADVSASGRLAASVASLRLAADPADHHHAGRRSTAIAAICSSVGCGSWGQWFR